MALVSEIFKKLLVTIIAAPILAFFTFVYRDSLSAAISSYSLYYWDLYWYWPLAALAFVVTLFVCARPLFLPVWFLSCLLFALHRSGLLLEDRLLLFFVVFCVALVETAVVACWGLWRLVLEVKHAPIPPRPGSGG